MKKFLAIALIAVSFVACNDEEKTETEITTTEDTMITTPVDTMMTAPMDTTTTPMVDTTINN